MTTKKILSRIAIIISVILAIFVLIILHNYSLVQHMRGLMEGVTTTRSQDSILFYILLYLVFIIQHVYISYLQYKKDTNLLPFFITIAMTLAIGLNMINNLFFVDGLYFQFPFLALSAWCLFVAYIRPGEDKRTKILHRISFALIIPFLVGTLALLSRNIFPSNTMIDFVFKTLVGYQAVLIIISPILLIILTCGTARFLYKKSEKFPWISSSLVLFSLHCLILSVIWIFFEAIFDRGFGGRRDYNLRSYIFYGYILLSLGYFVYHQRKKKNTIEVFVGIVGLVLIIVPQIFFDKYATSYQLSNKNAIFLDRNPDIYTDSSYENSILDQCQLPNRSDRVREGFTLKNWLTPCTQRFWHYRYDVDLYRFLPFFLYLFLLSFGLYAKVVLDIGRSNRGERGKIQG